MIPDWNDREGLQRDLLAWFTAHRRALPWRDRSSLYAIWVAEIMLQQTTVETVVPYYQRFLTRFPDVESLAGAELSEVLLLWSGLGYYRRARMLHAAAKQIVSAGQMPADAEQWRALPGVGDYAAGAIASLGLGQRVPAVDANARRVLLRWLCPDPETAASIKPAQLRKLAAAMVPGQRPGDWNEALMELGSLICRARDPRCDECPVQVYCRAATGGDPGSVPRRKPKPERIPVALAQLAVTDGSRVLLTPPETPPVMPAPEGWAVARQDLGTLFRGLFGLPTTPWFATGPRLPEPELWMPFLGDSFPGTPLRPVVAGEVRHSVTRFGLTVQVHMCALPDGAAREWDPPAGWCWGRLADPDVPLSSLARKVLKATGLS